jgi:hypothetical protein
MKSSNDLLTPKKKIALKPLSDRDLEIVIGGVIEPGDPRIAAVLHVPEIGPDGKEEG